MQDRQKLNAIEQLYQIVDKQQLNLSQENANIESLKHYIDTQFFKKKKAEE